MFHPPTLLRTSDKGTDISSYTTEPIEPIIERNTHNITGNQPLSTSSTLSGPSPTSKVVLPSTIIPTYVDSMVHSEPESPTQSRDRHDGESNETTLKFKYKLGSVTTSNDETVIISPKTEDASQEHLLQAIDLLNGLAAMDSADYQSSLLLLDDTQAQTILSVTPQIVKLNQHIHRLHSVVQNLTTENDQQTLELLHLHQTLETKNERMAQLEDAVTKLYQRNTKLKARTKSNQSRTRKLFQQLQEFTANATKRKQEDDFAKLAMQIQHHELIMNRERTDSNFSELDGLQDFLQDSASVASDLDTASTHSSVFDDGVVTLRISRDLNATWPPLQVSGDEELDQPLIDDNALIHQKQELDDICTKSQRILHNKHHNPNPFSMLLGPRTAQAYTLQFVEPFQLQFVALSLLTTENETMSNNIGTDMHISNTAFAVCGFHGFDCELNIKPTLGARLLQINKTNLDPSWTVNDLEQHIRQQGPRVSMTFRNDVWSKSQKEALQIAIQEHERLNPESTVSHQPAFINPFSRKRGQSGDNMSLSGTPNKNILGFLNFHGIHKDTTDISKTPPTDLKAMKEINHDVTLSADSCSDPMLDPTPMHFESNSKELVMASVMSKSNFKPEDAECRCSSEKQDLLPLAVKEQECISMPNGNTSTTESLPTSRAAKSHGHPQNNTKRECIVKLEGVEVGCNNNCILDAIAIVLKVPVEEIQSRKLVAIDIKAKESVDVFVRFFEPIHEITEFVDRLNIGDLTIQGKPISKASILSLDEDGTTEYNGPDNSMAMQEEINHDFPQLQKLQKDTGQKFISSMQQMGKIFNFR